MSLDEYGKKGDTWAVGSIESGFEALSRSPEFDGPVEMLEPGHACNDHIALLYENREEQLASVVPFLRQGLERGEQCMYVTGDVPRDRLVGALRDGGVDVDAALDSGALTFHTVEETYLRDGTFDPDEMIEFYADAVATATEEFSALRVAAETNWLADDRVDLESFMAYESKINDLFEDHRCTAMCQYDRNRFRPEVVRDLVQTHPHLVYDGTLCHNIYYTPPGEFFGPDRAANEVDRMMRSLVDRTEARVALGRREEFLRRLYRVTSDPSRSFDDRLGDVLELGREWFDLDFGLVSRVDEHAGELEIYRATGNHELIETGRRADLSDTYCRRVLDADGPVAVTNAVADGWGDDPAYRTYGLESYVGTALTVEGEVYGTLCFGSREPVDDPLSEAELTFLELVGQWIEFEFERQSRREYQRALYELAADTDAAFEERLQVLFDLGCERFDLQLGGLARLDPHEDRFEIEAVSGDHDHLVPGATVALSETYCRTLVADGGTAAVTDGAAAGFEGTVARDEFGVESYLGTRIPVEDDHDRSLFFVSGDRRDRAFTEGERTFLDLMGQWIGYELRQRRRETQLAALNGLGREITDAETRADVVERTVAHAEEALRLPVAAVVTYDSDCGELATAASTARAEDELPTAALCARPDGPLWEAFVAGEVHRIDDVGEVDGSGETLTEAVGVPLSRQGLLVVATSATGGFGPAELEFVETTAATVEAACTRADREQQLHRREETLEAQNESLERLNRVNDIIRDIDQALVGAASRAAVERVVCEQLAEVGPYELAWIGEHDAIAEEITPKEGVGASEEDLATLAVGTGDGPETESFVARAVAEQETQVVDDVLADDGFEPWRQTALNCGYHACIGLPLIYGETCYGVLVVCAEQPGVFDELERSVLTEMADTIAYAINATESKKAIVSDEVTHLSFDLEGADLPIVELARRHGYGVSLESIVPGGNGEFRAVVSTTGIAPTPDCPVADDLPSIDDFSLIAAYDERPEPVALYEITLSDRSLFATALEHGGRPVEFSVDDEEATFAIELAGDAAVREIVGTFQSHYPGVELVAQRTRERSQQGPTEFFTGLADALTERQLEAIQLAHHSGYLEEPRRRSATELAEAMGISQPTFNSHLRAAQRKLCERLFDERAPAA